VEAVYQNLFNRASEAAGSVYWVGELDSGRIAKSTFILAVISGAKDTEEFGNDATILTNKTTVGLSFSHAGFNDTTDAREIMLEVTDDEGTVTAALEGYGIEVLPMARELLVGKTYYDAWVSDGVEGYAKLAFSETEITEDYYTDNIQQESSLSSYEILEHSVILIDEDVQSFCDVSGNDTAIQFSYNNDSSENYKMVFWSTLEDARINPSYFENGNNDVFDYSDIGSNPAMLSPNGGEVWTYGNNQTITWNSDLLGGQSIDIYVLHDDPTDLHNFSSTLPTLLGNKSWYQFAEDISNTGSYNVDPADLNGIGNAYVILIVSDSGHWDVSDSTITLTE